MKPKPRLVLPQIARVTRRPLGVNSGYLGFCAYCKIRNVWRAVSAKRYTRIAGKRFYATLLQFYVVCCVGSVEIQI